MNEVKMKDRTGTLVKLLYAVSAVMGIVFVYMLAVNVMYMKNYLETYLMSFSDMWVDTVQYVIAGSINYLVYAVLIFCGGKIINILKDGKLQCIQVTELDKENQHFGDEEAEEVQECCGISAEAVGVRKQRKKRQ